MKCLMILTNPRVFEKIHNVIPYLSSIADIDWLLLGEMSPKTKWYGNIDPRDAYRSLYGSVIKRLYHDSGFKFFGDNSEKKIPNDVFQNTYDFVIYDDNRTMPELSLPKLYQHFKSRGIPVYGNSHGNQDWSQVNLKQLGLGKSYDKLFVWGKKEYEIYRQIFDSELFLLGGIPSNDLLANNGSHVYDETFLLVITNFLGNRSSPFEVNFDHDFLKRYDLEKIAAKLDCNRILIKAKTRFEPPQYEDDKKYLEQLGLDANVVFDTSYPILDYSLIHSAKAIISAPSTLAIKGIQSYTPTAIIDGMGQIGSLYDFPISNSENDVIEKLSHPDFKLYNNWINFTVEGGTSYESRIIWFESLKRDLN